MTNGTNREKNTNKQVNAWLNWINGSTGAIMFFNRRSALLQMLSTVNFINWSDNNPVKAAAAFANQRQYWSDWSMIFNSDKLKERRGGLQQDAALRAITIDAAEMLGIEHRLGSIEVGKDANIIVCDGDLFHYRSFVQWAVVDGKMMYDKQRSSYFAHIRPRAEEVIDETEEVIDETEEVIDETEEETIIDAPEVVDNP
jgi:hypothetical protein